MSGSVKKYFDQAGKERVERYKRVESARKLPQRKVRAWEWAVYTILPAALVAAGTFPLFGLFLMPIAVVALYFLYRRLGIYLPLFVIAIYAVAALFFNYDVMTVVYVCFLLTAFCALVFSVQLKNYLLRAAVVMIAFSLGMFVGTSIVSAAENSTIPDVCAEYVCSHADEPFFDAYIRRQYDKADIKEQERVPEDSPIFKSTATEYAANELRDEINGYVPYYCIHFGATFALIAFFSATAINGGGASPYDENATETDIKKSVRSLGGAYRDGVKIGDMRLPRLYLLIFVLPALIASIALGIAGGLEAQSATVMHACITMPSEFAFVTLAVYIATLFCGRGRVVALVILGLLLVANVFFSVVLLVCSIFGVCDCILNIRYWIKYLSSD